MLCRSCGSTLEDAPGGAWCPRCSFGRTLGGAREGDPGPQGPGGWEAQYEVHYEIGRGAMGVVWLARERALDRLVALKVAGSWVGAEGNARLLREGRAAARLRHPNIVAIHAMGGEGTSAYLAMEFLEGGGLDERLREGPMPPREAARLVARVAGALEYAHREGLLHRDIKPSNILMDAEGEPHLADFGLVGQLGGVGDLTLPGHVLGTPAYLAPEALAGAGRIGPRTDVYGLGAVLYACLTGRAPFLGESAAAILAQLESSEPPAPRFLVPGVPLDLETICMKCLEKDPGRRYACAADLESDLGAYLEGRPIAARPVGLHEKLGRACVRHPALSVSIAVAMVCLVALAVGGPLMAIRLSRAQDVARVHLREALLARSKATRIAAQLGQRADALAAVEEAARIRPGMDARDELIAVLARPDIAVLGTHDIASMADAVVAMDPDHGRVVFERDPGQLEVRELRDGTLARAWTGPAEELWTFPALSADGRRAVCRNASGTVLVWDESAGETMLRLSGRPYVLTGRFKGYGQPDALSPDGRTLASALPGSGVSVHALGDGREVGRIATDTQATHVAFSPDGRLIAVGRGLLSREGRVVAFVWVFDAATRAEVSRLRVDKGFQTMKWSQDSRRIVVAGERLDVFRASDGVLLRSISDPKAMRGEFGPALGSMLLSASLSGEVALWGVIGARPLVEGSLGGQGNIAVDRTGIGIMKGAGLQKVRDVRIELSPIVRDWPTGSDTTGKNVLSAAVPTIDYRDDGRWLATATWGGVQLRKPDGEPVATLSLGSLSNYCSVRFSRDGGSLLVGTAEEGLLRIPILVEGAGASLGKPEVLDSEKPEFITALSRDGSRAVVTSFLSGFVKVIALDGSGRSARWELPGAAGAAFVEADAGVIASSLVTRADAKLEIRDAATGKTILRRLPYARGAHVDVTRDGRCAVVGTGPSNTAVLCTGDWSRAASLPVPVQGRGNQCALSADAAMLAVGVGAKVWLVDLATGRELAHLESASGGSYIPGLAFSPDGSKLAVFWESGMLSVWDIAQLRRELRARSLDW